MGAMAGGADDSRPAGAASAYGLELGNAFQLVDDVLDYRGESGTLGKNIGDDLREGKMTLPVILALAEGTDSRAARSSPPRLGQPDASETQVREVVAIMERYKTLVADRWTRPMPMPARHRRRLPPCPPRR